jgi:hypothetical protein
MRWPRYLILDVDDTLTVGGRLRPEGLSALQRASAAGMEVILNTGRSAGWGAALAAYLPGLSAVVVENGGAWFDLADLGSGAELPARLAFEGQGQGGRAALHALRERVAQRLGLSLVPTADDPFRLTDHTVVRSVPGGAEGAAILGEVRRVVAEETAGQGGVLASSVHIHFFLDGVGRERSKAAGVAALLERRGVADPTEALRRHAVAVGDSGNDASFFVPGRFALSVGVRNIERYLPELGVCRPRHITTAAEGEGLAELIEDLLAGRLGEGET